MRPYEPKVRRLDRICAGLVLGGFGTWLALGQAQSGPTSQPTTAAAEIWLRVTADQVNVRSRPDANSLPVLRVDRDTVLRASERDQYGWFRIIPPEGAFSYVAAEFVDRRGSGEGIVSVRSGTLRVRVGSLVHDLDPAQSEVQLLLARGATIRILGEQGPWLKIVPPDGVFVFVHQDNVESVSAEVARRLQAAHPAASQPATAPAVAAASQPTTLPATRPAVEPDLHGAWGQRLVLVEAAIEVENRKPLADQSWNDAITRLRPIATQREDPAVARLAAAWIDRLEKRVVEQDTVRAADEVLRRAARDQAQHQREQERIEQARQRAATQPEFAARGELLRSYAVEEREGRRWYKLVDPLSRKIEAYIEVGPDLGTDPETLLGRYVGVRGSRRADAALGADVVRVEEIQALEREAGPTHSQVAASGSWVRRLSR
jgi:hypothetical protein